jgi:tRNA(Ile)-lysidine synthase
MAMLAALFAVIGGKSLFCLHVEHGIRPSEESSGDAEFVRGFCEKLGIKCRIVSIRPGKAASFARRRGVGIEAAARFFRRRALFKQAALLGENTFILTAHTKDDMLETALMRVLRGSGPSGLAIMPASRGRILRPLLGVTRAGIISYLNEKKILWREDSTNMDEKFLRNRVRRRLIPLLNESFPSWKSALASMAETQSLAADFIGMEAQNRIVWNMEKTPHSFTDEGNFFAQPQIIREEALFQGIDVLLSGRKNPRPVKRSSLRLFCAGFAAAADLGPVRLRREGGRVILSRVRKEFYESGFSLLIKEPGLYNLKKTSIEVSAADASLPQNGGFLAGLPLVFRRSFNSDFIVCNGKKTRRRNLEKNLISAVDVFGAAAFIGKAGLLSARDLPLQDGGNQMFYFVTVKRSNNTGAERGCIDV